MSYFSFCHKLLICCFAAACLTLASCRTQHSAVTETSKDSVRVEVRERLVLQPDTVFVDIPLQTAEQERRDSFSRLETDFAVSEVWLNKDGTLKHRLKNKAKKLSVPTNKEIQYRDSIVYRDSKKERSKTNTVYVNRLTKFQKAQICALWALILFFAYKYRREIVKFIVGVFRRK